MSEPGQPYRWIMPAWMEAYRDSICHTGGNTVEDLMANYHLAGEEGARLMRTNLPVYLLSQMVGAQIDLLKIMRSRGQLE